MRIGVVGLGKLGLCAAACFAARGHRVLGFDTNGELMAALRVRDCPIQETGLEDLLPVAWPNFSLAEDPTAMVRQTDLSFIIVPTPSQADGRFSNSSIEDVLGAIGLALKHQDAFHVVNVVSTVMPGSCDRSFKPFLENLSGKVCGRDFGLVYNPEFIALGSVIHNFLNPDLVLIGTSDAYSGNLVRELYQSTCDNRPHMAVMSLINAEITKLSLNCFVTMKISFANELAAICEQVLGAEVDVITAALGADSRIGKKYLKGGLGFGGPCFPRDNLAFQVFAREAGWQARLGPQVVAVNMSVPERLLRLITAHTTKNATVSLLGLAYKPGTHIVEESQSLELAMGLAKAGYRVRVHDPQALEEARLLLNDRVAYCKDPYACLEQAEAIVILTEWPLYARLDWAGIGASFHEANSRPLLVDSWRLVPKEAQNFFQYHCLGRGLPATPESHEAPEPEIFTSRYRQREGFLGLPSV